MENKVLMVTAFGIQGFEFLKASQKAMLTCTKIDLKYDIIKKWMYKSGSTEILLVIVHYGSTCFCNLIMKPYLIHIT